jgi:hypothetical protein
MTFLFLIREGVVSGRECGRAGKHGVTRAPSFPDRIKALGLVPMRFGLQGCRTSSLLLFLVMQSAEALLVF